MRTYRRLDDDWCASIDQPNPFEDTIRFEYSDINDIDKFAPWFSAQNYVLHINKSKPSVIHVFDKHYKISGFYIKAEIVDEKVWITFQHRKFGKYQINFA